MRQIVVGKNSHVWSRLAVRDCVREAHIQAIGHSDVAGFGFEQGDQVWVLSYSHRPEENRRLLAALGDSGAGRIIYVSSSSAVVADRTRCYRYPEVKATAERDALRLPNAAILVVGQMYDDVDELARGICAATRFDALARHIADGQSPPIGSRTCLFDLIARPFSNPLERGVHRVYGALIGLSRNWPCLLRPLDLILRTFGVRWYGYVFLSNRHWAAAHGAASIGGVPTD